MTSYRLSELPNPGRTSAPASAGIIIGAGGITPTGTISITENGTYDVTQYASADVNVSGGGSQEYDITIEPAEGGSIETLVLGPSGDPSPASKAEGGSIVYISVTPDSGYSVSSCEVLLFEDPIPLDFGRNTGSFIMPKYPVTVVVELIR